MEYSVIIAAGGSGTRMKSDVPKQFIEVFGKPVIFYSIEKFLNFSSQIRIIVVLPQNMIDLWKSYCEKFYFFDKIEVAIGGKTRFHSVFNGVQMLNDNGVVAIHDAARPLVSVDTIKKALEVASSIGNAVPAISINDSLRIVENSYNFRIDREKIKIIQTPQCFSIDVIKRAYQQPYNEFFTDDASVVENMGIKINLIEGNRENFKITTESDIKLLKYYLSMQD